MKFNEYVGLKNLKTSKPKSLPSIHQVSSISLLDGHERAHPPFSDTLIKYSGCLPQKKVISQLKWYLICKKTLKKKNISTLW